MNEVLFDTLIGVGVALVAAPLTSLLLIALLRGESVPWREYVAYFLGRR